jgi:hypothetical protein
LLPANRTFGPDATVPLGLPSPGSQRQGRDRRAWLRANLRRGHYELAVEEPVNQRMAVAFDEFALVI